MSESSRSITPSVFPASSIAEDRSVPKALGKLARWRIETTVVRTIFIVVDDQNGFECSSERGRHDFTLQVKIALSYS